ncbi:MAG: hypothetical protein ACHRHE_07065 [Tepidisphaerales bacterium]
MPRFAFSALAAIFLVHDMAKAPTIIDILVLGDHPAAYLAAALLAHKSKLRIGHAQIPGQHHADRFVLVHSDFFSLHPLLEPLRRKMKLKQLYGAQFIADDGTHSEYRCKSALSGVGSLKEVRTATEKVAAGEGVEFLRPKEVRVLRVDDKGVQVSFGNQIVHPTALVLADALPSDQARILGLPEEWERGVVRKYSWIRLKPGKNLELSSRPMMPMSLNLAGLLGWAWLMPGEREIQLCVEQAPETVAEYPPSSLLRRWADLLARQGVFRSAVNIDPAHVQTIDMPAAGALAHEGVANRTLLVGPAGGFYAATSEDVYPNCWSTIFAADVIKKSLKQPHLQDALQTYRHIWRTTLGNYLRGPQQNLRFLLPLIYRNPIMTQRMVEGVLVGRAS